MSPDAGKKTLVRLQNREAETRYLEENREHLEANYAGKWLALDGDKLLAIGSSSREVSEAAAEMGVEHPLVIAVKRKDYQKVYINRTLRAIRDPQ